MQTHKFGVQLVGFAPGGKYLVSIGFPQDGAVTVWDWRAATTVATNKITGVKVSDQSRDEYSATFFFSFPSLHISRSPSHGQVESMAFTEDGTLVTAGPRHLKFWYLEQCLKANKDKVGKKNHISRKFR